MTFSRATIQFCGEITILWRNSKICDYYILFIGFVQHVYDNGPALAQYVYNIVHSSECNCACIFSLLSCSSCVCANAIFHCLVHDMSRHFVYINYMHCASSCGMSCISIFRVPVHDMSPFSTIYNYTYIHTYMSPV